MAEWRKFEGLGSVFALAEGKRIVRRVTDYKAVPDPPSWYAGSTFEAVELEDGSWIAIEYDEGSPNYSSWTPGSPGFCVIWTRDG